MPSAREQISRNERADDLVDASTQVAEAELHIGACGAALVDAWDHHWASLVELRIDAADAILTALAQWIADLDGDNPARAALHEAQQQSSVRLAQQEAGLRLQSTMLEAQQLALHEEQTALQQGRDQAPPPPYLRGQLARATKPGAALWQLVEFRATNQAGQAGQIDEINEINTLQRAGLEAALQASGLLDAWLAPDGSLQLPDQTDTFDTALVARAPQALSLADWLEPAQNDAVDAAVILRLLASIACCAEDLQLPQDQPGLLQVEAALGDVERALQELLLAAQNARHALPALASQRVRCDETLQNGAACRAQLEQCECLLQERDARQQALRGAVGVKVEELKQRLAATRQAVEDGERAQKADSLALSRASEQRARCEPRVEDSAATLLERTSARQQAILGLANFVQTGLLAVALPELDTGESGAAWTIEAALNVARRTEQGLQEINAEDADWSRMQNQISRDYSELLTALTALGHQAQADTTDYGLIVTIIYQNRPERPDLIELRITEEIAQRRELLTARETEVLENHWQAEVAAAIQRLLRDSERRLAAINAELATLPTSTGVKFRLVWQALAEHQFRCLVGARPQGGRQHAAKPHHQRTRARR